LLLLSTVAQALDTCESVPLRTPHRICEQRSTQSAPTVCLICASAHTPSFLSATTSVSAPGLVSNVGGSVGESFHAALQVFALQVRPPPGR
jgi:hypothetical protein